MRARAAASMGVGTLHASRRFDLENGVESEQGWGDVCWVVRDNRRVLVPIIGARLCALGTVSFETLGYAELLALTYLSESIPGHLGGENKLTPGSVVAVRTRSGQLAKMQVQKWDGTDLLIRWQTCPRQPQYRDLKVVVGSAPVWLVSRYVVDCTYEAPDGSIHSCGKGKFGADGGVVEDRITDADAGFPETARVVVAVDFQPDTGLQGVVLHFEPEVGPAGVTLLYEPAQEIRKVKLVFDLTPPAKAQDYVLIRWAYRSGSSTGSGSQRTLTGSEIQENVAYHEIAFPPDGATNATVDLTIDGLYQGKELVQFKQSVSLPAFALAFRFRKQGSGPHYRLEAF